MFRGVIQWPLSDARWYFIDVVANSFTIFETFAYQIYQLRYKKYTIKAYVAIFFFSDFVKRLYKHHSLKIIIDFFFILFFDSSGFTGLNIDTFICNFCRQWKNVKGLDQEKWNKKLGSHWSCIHIFLQGGWSQHVLLEGRYKGSKSRSRNNFQINKDILWRVLHRWLLKMILWFAFCICVFCLSQFRDSTLTF